MFDIVGDAMSVVGDRSASDAVVRRLAQILDADATAVGFVDEGQLHLFGMHGYDVGVRQRLLGRRAPGPLRRVPGVASPRQERRETMATDPLRRVRRTTHDIPLTFGILFSLASETIAFFQQVSLREYLLDTRWTPLFSSKRFGSASENCSRV